MVKLISISHSHPHLFHSLYTLYASPTYIYYTRYYIMILLLFVSLCIYTVYELLHATLPIGGINRHMPLHNSHRYLYTSLDTAHLPSYRPHKDINKMRHRYSGYYPLELIDYFRDQFNDEKSFQYYIDMDQTHKIDIVYTWVNGSQEEHIHTLNSYLYTHNYTHDNDTYDINHQPVNEDTAIYRYSSSKDELLYSIRSIEKYMSWYNHIYIVTSGQIPTFLNTSHPRLTIIPHTTIYPNHTHLPTFSSCSIEAHIHRIPGLSEYFIYMNDDLFIKQYMQMNDFITDDGYEVIPFEGVPVDECRTAEWDDDDNMIPTYTADRAECKPLPFTSLNMVRYVDNIYTHRYNDTRQRYVIAHSPVLFSRTLIQRMQHEFPRYWYETSTHTIRSPYDMQLQFAAKYYSIHNHYAYTVSDHHKYRTEPLMDKHADSIHEYLNSIWNHPVNYTTVCLNDQVVDTLNIEKIRDGMKEFMRSKYSEASQYELRGEYRYHECNIIQTKYQEIPTKEQMRNACY